MIGRLLFPDIGEYPIRTRQWVTDRGRCGDDWMNRFPSGSQRIKITERKTQMTLKKRFLMVFCSMMLLAGILGTGTSAVAAAREGLTDKPQVFITVDGIKNAANVGMVVATGTLQKSGDIDVVVLPHISVTVVGTKDTDRAFVRLKITEQGTVVVEKIEFSAASLQAFSENSVTSLQWRGFAEQDYNNFLSGDETTVRSGIDYYDDGSYLWNVNNPFHGASWLYWWTLEYLHWSWSPYDSSYAWISTDATFSQDGAYTHWQFIKYNATPGFWYLTSDFLGSYLPGGYVDTNGGRDNI